MTHKAIDQCTGTKVPDTDNLIKGTLNDKKKTAISMRTKSQKKAWEREGANFKKPIHTAATRRASGLNDTLVMPASPFIDASSSRPNVIKHCAVSMSQNLAVLSPEPDTI
jgi:hypothetical protein